MGPHNPPHDWRKCPIGYASTKRKRVICRLNGFTRLRVALVFMLVDMQNTVIA